MEEAPFQTKKRRPERIFTAENERNLSTGFLPFRFCGPKGGLLPGTGADFMRLSIHAEVLFFPFNTGGYADDRMALLFGFRQPGSHPGDFLKGEIPCTGIGP